MGTIRQQIIELLDKSEMTVREISQSLRIQEKEVYGHLDHIARSLGTLGKRLIINPSECLHCGYVFSDRRRFTKPGRCPNCRKTHIGAAGFRIE